VGSLFEQGHRFVMPLPKPSTEQRRNPRVSEMGFRRCNMFVRPILLSPILHVIVGGVHIRHLQR
jgi:hypothetical protein